MLVLVLVLLLVLLLVLVLLLLLLLLLLLVMVMAQVLWRLRVKWVRQVRHSVKLRLMRFALAQRHLTTWQQRARRRFRGQPGAWQARRRQTLSLKVSLWVSVRRKEPP